MKPEAKRKNSNFYDYALESDSLFKRGLAFQREKFKEANANDNEIEMCKALQNIKSEIKFKALSMSFDEEIKKIEETINWFKKLPIEYIKKTQEGLRFVPPIDLQMQANDRLVLSYEMIINIMQRLGLNEI